MNSILDTLATNFDSVIWQRGNDYYKEGLIGNVIKIGNLIKAESYGNSTYFLEIDLKKKMMTCTCPYDDACKHLAGLIIWLKHNRVVDVDNLSTLLNEKSKEELIDIFLKIFKDNPKLTTYLESLDEAAIEKLIKTLWFPMDGDDHSFYNQLTFILTVVKDSSRFNLKINLLKKLLDLFDHDPDSTMLEHHLDNYLMFLLKDRRLTNAQKKEIKGMIEGYPFDY